MSIRRISRTYLVGAALLAALLILLIYNWGKIYEALELLKNARPVGLVLTLVAIGASFLCAGQIYGRVLATLGYRARLLWLTAAAMVTVLVSQSIPAGTVGSYAFLTTSLRRRGIPATSVALVASLELLSWLGAMLLLFGFGVVYLMLTTGSTATGASYTAAASALTVLGSGLFVGSRPHATLHDWALRVKRSADRIFGPIWPDALVLRVVDEIDANRRLILEQPRRMVVLVCLQLIAFALHSLGLLAVLWSLGVVVSPLAVLAAYGLTLIVSTFTLLPGGGGTVEAALTLSLSAQGVPIEAALGATILFRLCSFWLLLPLGALCYRLLTRGR